MHKRTNILLLAGSIMLAWTVPAFRQAAFSSTGHFAVQAPRPNSGATTARTIRVRFFVDDAEQELGKAWLLEIRSGGIPIELHKVGKTHVIIGNISAPCSVRFKRGNEDVKFNNVAAHLFRCGGELVIAFITKPALLNKEVSLADGEPGRVERFSGYDEARSRVSEGWRKLSKEQIKSVRGAIFYSFTPDTDNDPVAETGSYFVVRH